MPLRVTLEGDPQIDSAVLIELRGHIPAETIQAIDAAVRATAPVELAGDLGEYTVELYGDWIPESEDAEGYQYGTVILTDAVVQPAYMLNGELGFSLGKAFKIKMPRIALPKIKLPKISLPKIKLPNLKINTKGLTKGIQNIGKGISKFGEKVVEAHKTAFDTLVAQPLQAVTQLASGLMPGMGQQAPQEQSQESQEQSAAQEDPYGQQYADPYAQDPYAQQYSESYAPAASAPQYVETAYADQSGTQWVDEYGEQQVVTPVPATTGGLGDMFKNPMILIAIIAAIFFLMMNKKGKR